MDTQSNTMTGEVDSKPVGIPEIYALKLLRIQEVNANTTLSKSCINLWVAQGRFPKPITLSPTVKVWRASDIADWIDQQASKAEEEDRRQELSGQPSASTAVSTASQKAKAALKGRQANQTQLLKSKNRDASQYATESSPTGRRHTDPPDRARQTSRLLVSDADSQTLRRNAGGSK